MDFSDRFPKIVQCAQVRIDEGGIEGLIQVKNINLRNKPSIRQNPTVHL
jgi:hypothetical protein